MTIYVITSAAFPDDIVEVTRYASSADFWRKSKNDWIVTEAPAATAEELAQVEALEAWLYDNYNAGAHWIVETTPKERHVIELRRQTLGEYRVALERHWLALQDHSDEIRAA